MNNTIFVPENKEISVQYSDLHFNETPKSLHYHNCNEIYFLLNGTRKYYFNNDIIELNKFDCIILKQGTFHITFGGENYDRYLLLYKNSFIDKYATPILKEYIEKIYSKRKITISSKDFYKLCSILSKMENKSDEQLFIDFLQVISILINNMDNDLSESNVKKDLIIKILEYIDRNFKDITELKDICDKFYITREHLCRIFKKHLNVTVFGYINTVKIKYACELLVNSDKSITDIAMMSGFNSSMYFSKVFKEFMGTTPGMYRKTNYAP